MEKYGAKNIEPATREVMVGYKQVRTPNDFEYRYYNVNLLL